MGRLIRRTPEEKLGLRASVSASLALEDCRIESGNLLGGEGQGLLIAMAALDHSRVGIAAQAVGIHRRALELAISYARQRVQFDRPIAEFQAIRFTLAEMATRLEAARALTQAAAIAAGSRDAGRLDRAAGGLGTPPYVGPITLQLLKYELRNEWIMIA